MGGAMFNGGGLLYVQKLVIQLYFCIEDFNVSLKVKLLNA